MNGYDILDAYDKKRRQSRETSQTENEQTATRGEELLNEYDRQLRKQAAARTSGKMQTYLKQWYNDSKGVSSAYSDWQKNGGAGQSDKDTDSAYTTAADRQEDLLTQADWLKTRLKRDADVYGQDEVDKIIQGIDGILAQNTAALDAFRDNKQNASAYRETKESAKTQGLEVADPYTFYWNKKNGNKAMEQWDSYADYLGAVQENTFQKGAYSLAKSKTQEQLENALSQAEDTFRENVRQEGKLMQDIAAIKADPYADKSKVSTLEKQLEQVKSAIEQARSDKKTISQSMEYRKSIDIDNTRTKSATQAIEKAFAPVTNEDVDAAKVALEDAKKRAASRNAQESIQAQKEIPTLQEEYSRLYNAYEDYKAEGDSERQKMLALSDEDKVAYAYSKDSPMFQADMDYLGRSGWGAGKQVGYLVQKGYSWQDIETMAQQMSAQSGDRYQNKNELLAYVNQTNASDAKAEMMQELYGDSFLAKAAGTVASVPLNLVGGVVAFGEDTASQLLGDGLDTGRSVGHFLLDVGDTARGGVSAGIDNNFGRFIYDSMMSTVDSAAAISVGAATGMPDLTLAIMGSGSAARAIQEGKDRGLSDEAAYTTGLLAGMAEVAFEKISLENLSEVKKLLDSPASTVEAKIKKALTQMGVEGSEEVFTDLANAISDQIVNGNQSALMQSIDDSMAQGMTESEAIGQAMKDFAAQIGTSFLGGAFSGGVFSAGANVISRVQRRGVTKAQGAILNYSGMAPAAAQFTLEYVPENSRAYEQAQKILEKANNGGTLLARETGTMFRSGVEAYAKQTGSELSGALTQSGLRQTDAKAIADRLMNGEELSISQADRVRRRDGARAAVEQVMGIEIDRNADAADVATALQQAADTAFSMDNLIGRYYDGAQLGADAANGDVSTAAGEEIVPSFDAAQTGAQSKTDGFRLSDGHEATIWSTGEPVTVTGIAEMTDGGMVMALSDGTTMPLADLEIADTGLSAMLSAAQAYTKTTKQARAFVSGYNGTIPVEQYQTGFEYARSRAATGVGAAQVAQELGVRAQQMGTRAVQNAVAVGANEKSAAEKGDATIQNSSTRNTTMEKDKAWLREETERVTSGQTAQEIQQEKEKTSGSALQEDVKAAKKVAAKTPEKTSARHQYVPVDADTRQQLQEAGVNGRAINKIDKLAKALNRQVILYYEEGTTVNGYEKDGVLYINMARKASRYYTVLGHEMTHSLERSKLYGSLQSYLLGSELLKDWLKKNGFADLEEAVQDRIALYKENGQTLSETGAKRDIVADLCGEYLIQGRYDNAMKLRVYSSRLFTAVRNFVESVFNKLANRFGHGDAMTKQLRTTRDLYRRVMLDAEKAEKQGDGQNHSIDTRFYAQLDNWDGKNTNIVFTVGNTSKALQSVGIKNQEIRMRSGMMLQKMSKHPEMTLDVFRQIPAMLEHPVIVQFSDAIDQKTGKPKYDSRITVLGELYAEMDVDGKTESHPVLVSLELLPTNQKGTTILDFSVVTSAYAKQALQKYINDNSILYIEPNKKRTDGWLSLNRLQLPLGENQYGSIRRIAYDGQKVKVENSTKKTAMQIAMEKAGAIDSYGTIISEEDENRAQEKHSFSREQTQAELTQQYQTKVDQILNMQDTTPSSVIIGYTPELYQQLGMPSLPFVIGSGHVYSTAKTESEAKQDGNFHKGTHYHGLGDAAVKNIYSALQDPVMILASKDVKKTASPMRSTHSVVAIVDVGQAGKSLLLPIEITAERTVNGERMDVNVLSSAYQRNVSELVREAIALENSGDVGIYYAKKEATTLIGAGVQFPIRLQEMIASNAIIRSFDQKVNRKISDVTQSLQFKRWFGDWQNHPERASKVVDADGKPLVMYHGTKAENGDFTVFDYSKAVKKGGHGLKALGKGNYFTSKPLDGSERFGSRVIKAYLSIKKPFVYDASNGDAVSLAEQVAKKTGADTKGLSYEALQHKMRELGYDGVIEYKRDGSLGIAVTFDSTQIKSATDNIGTFDGSNADIRYSLSAREQMDAMVEEYGAIPKGEHPKAEVQVPQQTSENRKVRRFVRTVLESGHLNAEMVEDVNKAIVKEALSYVPTTNEQVVQRAKDKLSAYGTERAMGSFLSDMENKAPTEDSFALGEVLLYTAAKHEDAKTVMELVATLAEAGTRTGRALQSMRMLKKMPGLGQLLYVQRVVDRLNQDIEVKNRGVSEEKRVTPIEIDENLATDLAEAKTTEESEHIADMLLWDIAEQTKKATWVDKWNEWRYMAMLANPRTHIRNFIGNALFLPAVRLKDAIAIPLERVLVQRYGGQMSKAYRIDEAYKEYARRNFDDPETQKLLRGGGKYNPENVIQARRQVFNTGALETLRRKNSDWLEREDTLFLKRHYIHAMAGYLQANGIDIDALAQDRSQMTAQQRRTIAAAEEYAAQEARKATYRDASEIANWIYDLSKKNTFAKIMVEGVIPFKKTPINILKRGVEYSPAGLLYSLATGFKKVRSGQITAAAFVDGIASGLSGTIVMALGMLLQSMGVLRGGWGDDEKENAFEALQGVQPYALELGGVSYTIDWAAPMTMPLFMGAELMKVLNGEYENATVGDVTQVFFGVAEPMFDMSMLDGLNNMLEHISHAEGGNKLTAIAEEATTSYFSQAVPTIFGQIARTVDDTRRTTYVDKNSPLNKNTQYFLQKIRNKIPVVSLFSEPYVDEWGREEVEGNVLVRAFQNFISPSYISKLESDDAVTQELQRLYDATGESKVFPKKMDKYIKIDGERVDLSAEEYTALSKKCGSAAYQMLSSIIGSAEYAQMSDEDKLAVIQDVYSLAGAVAKEAVSEYQASGWTGSAIDMNQETGVAMEDYVIRRGTQRAGKEQDDEQESSSTSRFRKSDMWMALEGDDADSVAVIVDSFVQDAADSKEKKKIISSIKSSLTAHYKPLYQQAYLDGDQARMQEIKLLLDKAVLRKYGIRYSFKDHYQKWQQEAKEK